MNSMRISSLASALLLVCSAVRAEWTGPTGLYFDSTVPVETKQMHCPMSFMTGFTASYGRSKKGDRDTYDFQMRCGDRWGLWFGLDTFGVKVRTEKTFECPAGLSMTGVQVKRGRIENGDQDFYDFKLQCGGVWEEYMNMKFSRQVEEKQLECPRGEMVFGLKISRGFREHGDMDIYDLELNCKAVDKKATSLRPLPTLKKLGLKKNVLLWSVKDVAKWLTALGLKEYVPKFQENRVHGDVMFQLSELHLIEMGMTIMGDRLYLMEALTQLLETVAVWDEATQQFVINVDADGTQTALAEQLAKLKKLGTPQQLGAPSSHKQNGQLLGPSSGGSGGSAATQDPYKGSEVVSLTDATFNAWLSKGQAWVVEFYAPWCGHCKKLIPELTALATSLKGHVRVGAVDATVNRRVAQQNGVAYYPTIKFFIEGAQEEYLGAHTAEGIARFVIEKLQGAQGGTSQVQYSAQGQQQRKRANY